MANQGDIESQLNLGFIYFMREDYTGAFKWYRKGAEQGHSNAQYMLGLMYDNGEGVQQDYYESLKWYKKAAEQGYSEANNNIGVMYMKGLGVEINYKEAIKWFEKALQYDKDNNKAEHNLRVAKQSSGCFIATAVYNSPTAPKVMILREFRDQKLLTTSLGESFVKFYYKHSPPIANFLSKPNQANQDNQGTTAFVP